jgi:hypothetical protein
VGLLSPPAIEGGPAEEAGWGRRGAAAGAPPAGWWRPADGARDRRGAHDDGGGAGYSAGA